MSEPLERAKATPAVAFCFLINPLLARETWARERLAAFAGQAVELRPPLLPPLRLTLLADGSVGDGGGEPDAVIDLEGIHGGPLAEELRLLAKHLRPDLEEELSRLVGDVAAHRIGQAGRAFLRWQVDSARRLSETLAAYGTDEARLLVRRAELGGFSEGLARLEGRMSALAARISRLA